MITFTTKLKPQTMGKAKVFIVNHENQAKHKVFFVDHENQQKNYQLIYPGELVQHENQADTKVFIVNHENQADIKILRKNFPS